MAKSEGELTDLIQWIHGGADKVHLVGLSGAARSYFFARILAQIHRPCLVLVPDRRAAESLYRELGFFMAGGGAERLFEFPPYDISPLSGLSPQGSVVTRRLRALQALLSVHDAVVITCLEALSFRIIPKEKFVRRLDLLQAGEELDRERFVQSIEMLGYQRSSLVEEIGDYSVRGGVIDLFSPSFPVPVRLEFWGDRLESIRNFDPASQRSQDFLEEMTLLPASEIIVDEEGCRRARSMGRLPLAEGAGMRFPGQEAWLNHFYPSLDTLLEYLPKEGLATLSDPHRFSTEGQVVAQRFFNSLERFRKEAAEKGTPFPDTEGVFVPFEQLMEQLARYQALHVSGLELTSEAEAGRTVRVTGPSEWNGAAEIRLSGKGRVSMAPLAERISRFRESRGRVVLVCRNSPQADRLKRILDNYEVGVEEVVEGWQEVPSGPGVTICLGRITRGFTWPDTGLLVITEDEIFGSKRSSSFRGDRAKESPLRESSLSELRKGDLVVHEEHGIGLYTGLSKMEIDRKVNEFVLIEYAQGDRLYIPADRISVLQKYVGMDGMDVRLDRLGGRSWDVAKQKAKSSVKKIAKQLIDLYAVRKYRKGYAFSPPDAYYREFEAGFEHEETADQIKVVEDVLEDMASEQPMDRLVCGDVGYGKTEVAVRAAFKAVSDGKQVALLVPTTVLAQQHYETFSRRLGPYPIRVGLLSRFRTKPEQAKTLAQLRSGEIDIVIGTHRIFQKDVSFHNLGLLVIDEEQRFGVKQKEALKRYRSLVDVLALTATPIPRTLHMSLMGVRDLSIIETPPHDRLDIETYLSGYDEPLIARAIQKELDRGGQVFFVHNRVQTIEAAAQRLRDLVPGARYAVAHGQMNERDLEGTMMRFLKKEVDVLVCSTIIESGLDIPTANTIIIDEADRFGLAQIYQLRGRVGRSKEKAYAYLLLSDGAVLTRDAEKRLKALMDFSHLGAGLHLALHDLRIRGGGNILGFSQSGHISAVGYELYLRLIERAIAELKGEEWHDEINPEINVDIPAFLPADYVLDADIRLNLYRRLSGLKDASELTSIKEEVRDRFGPPPQEVKNLLGVMAIRLLLKRMGIHRLDLGEGHMLLTFSETMGMDPEKIIRGVGNAPGKFRFIAQNKLKVRLHQVPASERLDGAGRVLAAMAREWQTADGQPESHRIGQRRW